MSVVCASEAKVWQFGPHHLARLISFRMMNTPAPRRTSPIKFELDFRVIFRTPLQLFYRLCQTGKLLVEPIRSRAKSILFLLRLPQFETVPFRIRRPSKLPVRFVLHFFVNLHAFFSQLREDVIQIRHAIIDHQRRFARAKIFRRLRKNRHHPAAVQCKHSFVAKNLARACNLKVQLSFGDLIALSKSFHADSSPPCGLR